MSLMNLIRQGVLMDVSLMNLMWLMSTKEYEMDECA